ncbi:hypothetical protein ASG01_07985 [Chryseobacterium sp. Leaf180]|uniref:GEVED domain-containing protein n=1 Tax=Chryseobacterium sp. Leaf180 TaxID=1736289 RepID=UPI0006F7D177|nr:GEVED domain-containing protein [Chryseobacterium sp. Leaf180]KQR93793.1 hypothetical protein ASG01_07985 [Chryseobacterium sp. Leaf180]
MKKILLVFAFILAFVPRFSGQTGQIGTGTGTSDYLPIYSYYGYNYSQQIYTSAEMTTAVGTANFITAIKFYVNAAATPQTSFNEWKVYMGNTTQGTFTSNTNWVPLSGLQQVYSGTLPTMTSGTWVTIPLSTPFIWDGTSNVVISVDENSPGYSNFPAQSWGTYNAGANRGILYYNDSTNPDPASPPTAGSRYADIPRVQFTSASLQPCSTAPPAGITLGAVTSTTAVVSWTPTTGATYVLRYRAIPGGAWTTVNLTAPLSNSYTIPGLTELTQYEVEIATVCGGTQGAYSTALPFTTTAISYCTASPTSTFVDVYVSKVTVVSPGFPQMVSNSTTPPPFYSDYTTDPTRLVTFYRNSAGNSVTVNKTWPSGFSYDTGVRVWIDFNRNGVFETSEMVLDDPSNINATATATFSVPAGAYAGTNTLRMRVIAQEYGSPVPCGGFTYGEVEDYAVKLQDQPACTATPPSGLSISNITSVSATATWAPASGATYIIRYRTGTGAWTTVTVTGPPANVYQILALLESTTYEVQVATICGSITSAWSASVNFTTPSLAYCAANPTSTTVYEYLSNVTVTPNGYAPMVSNSTTPPPFYSDYTTDPTRLITLIRGNAGNTIAATKVWPNFAYAAGTRAWIDYNRNGIFETSELVLDSPSNTTVNVNNTFTVPTVAQGAYAGNLYVRMRVIMQEGGTPNACGTFTWGEVEDYSVRLIDLLPCTTAPPSNITVTNLTATTAYVSWLPASGATYRVRWRQIGQTLWQQQPLGYAPVTAGQSFYTITGLTESSNYEAQVLTICNGTVGNFSGSINFTTPPLTYCPMVGGASTDFISNVKVTPTGFPIVNNTSVQTNYILYTTPVINLEVGSAGNQISVSKSWSGSNFSDAVDVYIDYNRDGVFATSERILNSAASTITPVTATFTVPTTGVYTGPLNTTMRVILNRNNAPVMCTNPAIGEVEDYYVKLRPCSVTPPGPATFTAITQNSAIVNWVPATNNFNYIVQYRPLGSTTWVSINASSIGGNPPLTLSGLTPATTYQVQIAAVCAGTPGTFNAITTFTTRCDPTPPNVTISAVTSNSAVVTWNPIAANANYILRYRVVGSGPTGWITVTAPILPQPPLNSYTITGLNSFVNYEVQVANQCIGEITPNPWSNPVVFTTVRLCQIAPPGLTITQLNPTTAEVTWDAFPGATYLLQYRKVGIPSWTDVVTPINNYTLTNLLELTNYEMRVANICSGTPGTFTPLYFFTTPTVTYCAMSGAASAADFISKVNVAPNGKPVMDNPSAASNYTNYTGNPLKVIELVQGSSNNKITIDRTQSAASGIAVWIDFNRNGYFDINERILAEGPNSNATSTATFTVPTDAYISMSSIKYVVMRVVLQKGGVPVNCTNFANGEVEDYSVRISKLPEINSLNQTDIMIYPNPVKSVLNVRNISVKANYKIYSSSGQLLKSGLILNNKVDVSGLVNGMYVIDIEDVKGTAQKKFIKE